MWLILQKKCRKKIVIGFGSLFWQKIVIGSGSWKKGLCNALDIEKLCKTITEYFWFSMKIQNMYSSMICEWHFVLVCWYKWTYIIRGNYRNYIPFVLRLLWDSFPIFKSKFNKLLSRLMNVQREFWSILVWKRQQHSSRFSTSQSFSKRIVAELL